MDKNAVGRSGEPIEMRVELGKIREFAHAVKDPNPVYLDEEAAKAEAGGVMPPPTFFVTQGFWDDGRGSVDLDLDWKRVLHGGQEYEYRRPVYAGDVLTARTRVADIFTKPGKRGGEMSFAILETEYRNQRGETVAIARSTLIETGKPVEKKD